MRKRLVLLLLAIAALAVAVPARAQMEDASGKKWTIHGDVRVRGDYFENYDFADVDNGGIDDDAAIWPYTVRVGINGDITDNIKAMVDFRVDATFGSSPTFNEFGGEPRFVSSAFSSEDNINLYQGWIQIDHLFGWDSFSARIGRQEHTYGTELLLGDNDFYTGQSFDGVRLMWVNPRWEANAFYYKLLENSFNNPNLFNGYVGESMDTNLFGATFDWKMEKWGTVGANYIRFQGLDDGGTGTILYPASGIDTWGVRWNKPADDDSMFDWNVEYDTQDGDTGNDPVSQDLAGDVIEGWFGFTFHPGNSHHRFGVGYYNASGDDLGTAENEAFFPLFADGHAHNRLGNLDNTPSPIDQIISVENGGVSSGLSDIEDLSVSYTGRFRDDKHTVMFAVHMLALDEPIITGPGTTEDDLGIAWDINYLYAMNSNLGFEFNVSQGQPGDVQDFTVGGSADTAARYYAQVHLRW